MDVKELVQEAQEELAKEKQEITKRKIKERLKEISAAEKTLTRLRGQYEALLTKDVDEVAFEEEGW